MVWFRSSLLLPTLMAGISAAASSDRLPGTPDELLPAIVIIESENSSGTGFLAEIRGRIFLVTNLHVFASGEELEIKTLHGYPIVPQQPLAVSHTRDIVLAPVQWSGPVFRVAESLEELDVTIGDPVVVRGNAEGAGVSTSIVGNLLGIGPELVEIDAPFVPGNSGSPVFHTPTGTVIGIASFIREVNHPHRNTDTRPVDRPAPELVRRFALRLDNNAAWQPARSNQILEESVTVKAYAERTQLILHLVEALRGERDLGGLRSRPDVARLFTGLPEGLGLADPEPRPSTERHRKDLHFRLISFLHADTKAADEKIHLDYFRRQLFELIKERNQIGKHLRQSTASQYLP